MHRRSGSWRSCRICGSWLITGNHAMHLVLPQSPQALQHQQHSSQPLHFTRVIAVHTAACPALDCQRLQNFRSHCCGATAATTRASRRRCRTRSRCAAWWPPWRRMCTTSMRAWATPMGLRRAETPIEPEAYPLRPCIFKLMLKLPCIEVAIIF